MLQMRQEDSLHGGLGHPSLLCGEFSHPALVFPVGLAVAMAETGEPFTQQPL